MGRHDGAGALPSLVLGQVNAVDIFLTEGPTFAAKAKEVGKTWHDIPYADYWLDLYSSGLLAREELIAREPDRVKRFVEATMKAWAWSIEIRRRRSTIFKHNPAVDPDRRASTTASRSGTDDRHGKGRRVSATSTR